MQHYQHTLLRGFHIATAEMPHMESVAVGIFVPVGSRYESVELNGIAHFLEHMIFKGTAKRNALDLAKEIEGIGGTINAYTTEDQTCLETRGPAECLPRFLEIMSDMLWHSQFSEEEIEREREVINEEIVMYQENPGDHLHDLLSSSLWPDHPLGRSITGTESSISMIDKAALMAFSSAHYRSAGTTLSVAGRVSHAEVLRLAESFLPASSTPPATSQSYQRPSAPNSFQIIHDQREIEQTHLALAFHTLGRNSPVRHVLRMLSLLLGETMSSRFFQELREKRGLCYHIATDYSLYEDTGSFEIHIGLDSDRVPECISAIRSLIAEILNDGFSEAELSHTRSYASGQARISLETPNAHMGWMGDTLMTYGKIIDPVEARKQLVAVTREQLIDLARTIFKRENIAIASIGPQSDADMRALCQQLFPF